MICLSGLSTVGRVAVAGLQKNQTQEAFKTSDWWMNLIACTFLRPKPNGLACEEREVYQELLNKYLQVYIWKMNHRIAHAS